MEATDIYKLQESPNVTFADPVSETPYSDIFSVASRPILAGNMMDESSAREEAIDARIARIKSAGGEELQNPERGGYAHDAARVVMQRVQAGEVSYLDRGAETSRLARQMYEAKEAELAAKHGLQFGDIGEDAQKRLKEAQGQLGRAMDQPVNPILKYATEFAGGLLAQRRDPLFLGSLFFGPASATGKAAIARMATSALNQGLFNAGLSAMEQPAVQAWRNKTGQESGVVPALEDIGLAFAMGAIPGAAFQGAKEIVAPLRRLMSGRAERGDFAAVKEALGPVSELDAAGMKAGEESVAATEALTPERPADVPPELHDDLASAALRRADDPEAPSPEAVAALHEPTQREKFRVEWDEEKSQFNAMTDAGEHIGYLIDAFPKGGKEDAFTAYVHVNEEWRRKGVASALYDEFSKRHEGNIKPSGVISDEALEFWLKRDPNKVRQAINEDVANVVKEIKAGNLPEDYSPVQSYEDPRVAKMAQEAFDVAMGGKPSIGTPADRLKAAGTDREAFNAVRADLIEMSKDELNAIQYEYIGGREEWPTKREALTAIENHFRAREYEATRMVQVGKANEAMFGPQQELRDRIEAAAPANPREAMQAADEALDDFGRRDGAAQMHETLARAQLAGREAAKAATDAITQKPPRGAGTGDREAFAAVLVRSCK